ncbi:MAG TPA: M48 family metallopeptidase [Longimicrobiaceae bacterium]|nr:M48 family metallopeptidase [Longimicrobiaceae bacterium]
MFGTGRRWRPARRLARLLPFVALAACTSAIGVEEEAQIGDAYAAEIAAELPLIRDPAAVEELNRLGRALAQHADSTGRRYTFHLVDSPEVNAFAVPGGHVYVNAGLVEAADELAELAGVLGHEIAHVTERHGLEQMEKRRGAGLLVNLAYLLMGREPGLLEQVAIEGGGAAIFAKYGRDAEREADLEAIETLVAAGYHPEGMATFFEELLRTQDRQPGAVEQWFSTHPTSAERVREARAVIGTLGSLEEQLVRDTPRYQRFRERVREISTAQAP